MKKCSLLKKALTGAVIAFLLIAIDQITKLAAIARLKEHGPVSIWQGVFELKYLENRGAAFGLMQNKRYLFLVMTALVLIIIIYLYLKRIPNERRYIILNVIAILFFSGAIGNFIDRLHYGYVVDFFYFSLINFPIFNVADIYVTVGAGLLIFMGLFYYTEEDFDKILPPFKEKDDTKTNAD